MYMNYWSEDINYYFYLYIHIFHLATFAYMDGSTTISIVLSMVPLGSYVCVFVYIYICYN